MKITNYSNTEYIEFEKPDEYYAWISNSYNEEYFNKIYNFTNINDLSPMYQYQGNGYIKINKYLRDTYPKINDDYDKSIFNKAQIIQQFINQHTIKNNIITYRYVCDKEYKFLYKHKNKIKIINQFLSTTTIPSICSDRRYISGKLIKLLLPQNFNALAYNYNSKHPECEILLPFNTHLQFIRLEQKMPLFYCSYSIKEL